MSNKYKKSYLYRYNTALNNTLYPVILCLCCCIQNIKAK